MTHTCPLCSFAFEEAEMARGGCSSCASSPSGCGLLRCPACAYEWPAESSSSAVRFLRRIFGKKERVGDDA